MSSIDLQGGLLGGAGPPDAWPSPDSGPGAITSEHSGGLLDFIRQAIMALQHFAEQTHDDVERRRCTSASSACSRSSPTTPRGRTRRWN